MILHATRELQQRFSCRWFLCGVVLCCAFLSDPKSTQAGDNETFDEKPNFIVVLVDDLGAMDLSCQGSEYFKTPNIDSLAEQGLRFSQAYAACAVCSPTRAALQTGKYPARLGITDWIRARFQREGKGTPTANPTEYEGTASQKLLCPPNPYWMEHNEVTIAEVLRENGYRTGYIGKWHLGDEAWYPTSQGYEVNIGGCDYGQPPSYFDPYSQPNSKDPSLREGIPFLPSEKPGEFLTHREGREAAKLIRKWKDEPFYLQISHYAVHTPIQAIDEVAAKYKIEGKDLQQAKYAALVESVDDAMKEILAALKEAEIDSKTCIIFTSDNGGLDQNGRPTDNAPLRSGKGFPYEGGIRVPLLVRWPNLIPAKSQTDFPVSTIDLMPTILNAAGIKLPASQPLDGISLFPLLVDPVKAEMPSRQLLWHFPHYRGGEPPYSILRHNSYKLIKHWEGGVELYDLAEDPQEKTDLSLEKSAVAMKLESDLVESLKSMGAKLPLPNPSFKTDTGKKK